MSLWHATRGSSSNCADREQEPNISRLLEMVGRLADPRSPQGKRHELVFVLAAAVVAVLAGASNYRQIASEVADLPQSLLAKLGARCQLVYAALHLAQRGHPAAGAAERRRR